jgi:hypothetical protein
MYFQFLGDCRLSVIECVVFIEINLCTQRAEYRVGHRIRAREKSQLLIKLNCVKFYIPT